MPIRLTDYIDILGTFSFAVSGAFAAKEKRLDLFGVFILAFVTSIGGGTIRDLLLGDLPVDWMQHPRAGWVIVVGAAGSLFFGMRLQQIQKILNIFDALGLGLFTIIGIQKGLAHGLSPAVCIALGTITGCFGGVLRDVFLNKVPMIFQKEIYASASITGGGIYFLLVALHVPDIMRAALTILLIFIIRMIVVRYKLNLPVWETPKI
jgi:uncharacterized membrane protein YeiH